MGLLSRFRRSEPSAAPDLLYRRGDLQATSLGGDLSAVRRSHGPTAVLPSFVVEFVEECDDFARLSELISTHAERHGWDRLQLGELRRFLPEAISAGLLVSTRELLEACARSVEEEPPAQIEAIGIGTGGARLHLLERGLRSFAENMRGHGRRAEILVAENSRAPDSAARCREALAAWGKDYPEFAFRFADPARKSRFGERLSQMGACSPEAVEFALNDPLESGFSCGANRNALLLQAAGQMLSSLDDDVVCRLFAPPVADSAGLALFSDTDPHQRWLFSDRTAALAAGREEADDYLAAHERMLGRRPAAMLPAAAPVDFSRVADGLIHRLLAHPTRARATFTGHVGDPGIPTSAYYLYCDGENRERLTANAAHYRSVFPSRSVFTVAGAPMLGDASVSPGMAMGLDHRTLLPPFFPVLHAEDFSFGAALWQCCPDALCAHLPVAVYHEPGLGKPILTPEQIPKGAPFVVFEFAHLLRQLIFRASLPESAEAAMRMQALGRFFRELGGLPERDFDELLRREALEQASNRTSYLARQIEENPELPGYWRDDVQALIEHLRRSLAAPDFDIPLELQPDRSAAENRRFMQQLVARYGELLIEWPGMVEAARALRERGEGLME